LLQASSVPASRQSDSVPTSGAHFNPVVTIAERVRGTISSVEAGQYMIAQVLGGLAGSVAANLMFDLAAIDVSTKDRATASTFLAEVIATIGLLLVIYGVVTIGRPTLAAGTVAGYIGAAYWFTSSTSFANPAVTIGRIISDTFAGIAPASAPVFIAAQLVGAAIGIPLFRWLFANNIDPGQP